MQTINDTEQEKCRISAGLFEMHSEKFKLQHTKTVLLLQYFKLMKKQNGNSKKGQYQSTRKWSPLTNRANRRRQQSKLRVLRQVKAYNEIEMKQQDPVMGQEWIGFDRIRLIHLVPLIGK